eukprot:CAMPEP_0181040346 /NCGR_PEP_ID=MMETSP1070-20121207/10996_1 /TAXON_ID=265543 /ORGANISM="Minutocellus polymorphus, Strain NH13" /LENGTH=123 /DNA_ID=CAMNT_0023118343 /DNA_START=6 /DNA_END=377 /DNA_ORIENTATION=+
MTVYARVARTAGRTAVRSQRRQMGGSHAPAPEWTGIDKVVRGYFPEDYQLAGAILSGYGVLILAAVIKSSIGGKAPEPEPAAPVAAPAASSGDLPSIESPEFEKFIESADDAAIMKWVESASD